MSNYRKISRSPSKNLEFLAITEARIKAFCDWDAPKHLSELRDDCLRKLAGQKSFLKKELEDRNNVNRKISKVG